MLEQELLKALQELLALVESPEITSALLMAALHGQTATNEEAAEGERIIAQAHAVIAKAKGV